MSNYTAPRRKSKKDKDNELSSSSPPLVSSHHIPSSTVTDLISLASSPDNTQLITVNECENNMLRYEHMQDHYRKSKDFMWRFLDATHEKDFRDAHLRDLQRYLIVTYGPSKPPAHRLPQFAFEILETVISGNDNILKNLLLFAELYLAVPIYSWFIEGIPAQGIPPPALTDRDRFRHFVENILPTMYENLLSGTRQSWEKKGLDIPRFVSTAYTEMIVTCGYPELPPEMRLQNYIKNDVNSESSRRQFNEIFPIKVENRKQHGDDNEDDEDDDDEDDDNEREVMYKKVKIVSQNIGESSDDENINNNSTIL